MALTLTEVMIVPGTGNKRMAVWKVTGDGTSYQINVIDLKMSKIEAAFTENINNDYKVDVKVTTYDYVDGPVDVIEIGDGLGGEVILSDKEHLLLVFGY